MKVKLWTALTAFALMLGFSNVALARDTTLHLDFDSVVKKGLADGQLDGSVKFVLGRKAGRIVKTGVTTNQKTNAFNKSDEEACNWVLLSALIRMQESAKRHNANAVVDLVSYYRRKEFKSSKEFECHAGAMVAGVALKGSFANL